MLPASTITRYALELSFYLMGIALPSAHEGLKFLPRWVKKGFGGEMREHASADPSPRVGRGVRMNS
jgi:hypothetical protein